MDELAPSLRSSARGYAVSTEGSSPSNTDNNDTDSPGTHSTAGESGSERERETVIGRCTAAALGTGVDCILDEEFSASRETARVTGFPQVRGAK